MKGQWFIISAVIASGTFLAISLFFNSYYLIDTSETALIDGSYHFDNVKNGLERTIDLSDCTNMDRNMKTFVHFSKQELAKTGYFLHVEYEINNCNTRNVDYGVLLASDKYVRCYNIANPQAIVPGIVC